MPPPTVSIIIPCYNAEKYVAEAIQCALDQTYQGCEVIVVDDGSTDDSLAVIKSFGDKIRWHTGPNRGGCAARNRGFEMALGDWLQFLDADDLITTDKIQSHFDVPLRLDEISFTGWAHLWGRRLEKIESQNHLHRTHTDNIDFFVQLLNASPSYIPPHAWLVSREMTSNLGGWDETLTAAQDIDFFGRAVLAATRITHIPGGQAIYRQYEGLSVSKKKDMTACLSRVRAVTKIGKTALSIRPDPKVSRTIGDRIAQHALDASSISYVEALKILRLAKTFYPKPFQQNPSVFLRFFESVLGTRIAFTAQYLAKANFLKSHRLK